MNEYLDPRHFVYPLGLYQVLSLVRYFQGYVWPPYVHIIPNPSCMVQNKIIKVLKEILAVTYAVPNFSLTFLQRSLFQFNILPKVLLLC